MTTHAAAARAPSQHRERPFGRDHQSRGPPGNVGPGVFGRPVTARPRPRTLRGDRSMHPEVRLERLDVLVLERSDALHPGSGRRGARARRRRCRSPRRASARRRRGRRRRAPHGRAGASRAAPRRRAGSAPAASDTARRPCRRRGCGSAVRRTSRRRRSPARSASPGQAAASASAAARPVRTCGWSGARRPAHRAHDALQRSRDGGRGVGEPLRPRADLQQAVVRGLRPALRRARGGERARLQRCGSGKPPSATHTTSGVARRSSARGRRGACRDATRRGSRAAPGRRARASGGPACELARAARPSRQPGPTSCASARRCRGAGTARAPASARGRRGRPSGSPAPAIRTRRSSAPEKPKIAPSDSGSGA